MPLNLRWGYSHLTPMANVLPLHERNALWVLSQHALLFSPLTWLWLYRTFASTVPATSTTYLIWKQNERHFYKECLFIVNFQIPSLSNLLITLFLKKTGYATSQLVQVRSPLYCFFWASDLKGHTRLSTNTQCVLL